MAECTIVNLQEELAKEVASKQRQVTERDNERRRLARAELRKDPAYRFKEAISRRVNNHIMKLRDLTTPTAAAVDEEQMISFLAEDAEKNIAAEEATEAKILEIEKKFQLDVLAVQEKTASIVLSAQNKTFEELNKSKEIMHSAMKQSAKKIKEERSVSILLITSYFAASFSPCFLSFMRRTTGGHGVSREDHDSAHAHSCDRFCHASRT
jgi:hypothetical protein